MHLRRCHVINKNALRCQPRKSVHEGVSFARLVALVGSGQRDSELGHFKDGIYPKLSVETHAFVGSIEAASETRNAQVKAM